MLICILSKLTLYDTRVGYWGVGQERHEGQIMVDFSILRTICKARFSKNFSIRKHSRAQSYNIKPHLLSNFDSSCAFVCLIFRKMLLTNHSYD